MLPIAIAWQGYVKGGLVGAELFAVEAGIRIRDSTTCKQEKNKWLLSSHVKEIPHYL